MSVRTFFRHLLRESRGSRGKLVFFVACLAIGVAAVVAVAGFCEGLERGVRGEARQLLAADLAVHGTSPVPAAVKEAVDALDGARRADVLEMLTLVAAPGATGEAGRRSQLVELKSVDGAYPFYGELELEPPRPLAEFLDAGSAVVAPELLARLRLAVGDTLQIGGQGFRIAGVVRKEPDRVASAMSLGPRVFVDAAGLARAELVQFGSRVAYRTLVALPPVDEAGLEAVADRLAGLLAADRRHRVETWREAQPALRRGLDRMERYLGLAALLSLLIGGVGVAQTVRAWIAGRLDAIAVLKCLGYRPREVLALYLGQAAVLGLVASALGIAAGLGVQALAARLVAGLLPTRYLDLWQPWAMGRGLALGVGVALLFSLPPLLAARRTPPVRVLRRDAEPLPLDRLSSALVAAGLLGGVLLLAVWQSRSFDLGARFTGGLVVVAVSLSAAAWVLTRLAARPRRQARPWLRQGLSALARPGASTIGATVALGLGVLVILTMFLVERRLAAQFDDDVPSDAPTAFLIDIQPHQWEGVRAALEEHGATSIDTVPVITARFRKIGGVAVDELVEKADRAAQRDPGRRAANRDWALRREQRLAHFDALPEDNVIVGGELWSKPGVPEVSVEVEYAEYLDVGVGSMLEIDIQGVPIELEVTSLRTVDWGTFGLNFYVAVEPGELVEAPHYRIAAVHLPVDGEDALQDTLAFEHPNVTMIRTREVLERVRGILRQLGLGVRLLGWLTVVSGLAILGGAVSASSLRRGREAALLKTLGMTRRQVIAAFASEYALIGLVAGLIGSVGAGVLAWLITTRGLEVAWRFEPLGHAGALVGAVAMAVVAGLLASLRALAQRPVEALRVADP